MKRLIRTGGASLLVVTCVVLAGACSATTSLMNMGEGTMRPIADSYPTASPLSGDAPIGYWWCVVEFDIEKMRTSNTSRGPQTVNCRSGSALLTPYASSGYADGVEFRSDGTGHDLKIKQEGDGGIPADAFLVPGSPLLFSRDRELRWRILDDGRLHIQTQRDQYLDIEVVTPDVIRVSAERRAPDLMIRAGSPVAKRMMAFAACVEGNRNKPLFEMVDCGDPIF